MLFADIVGFTAMTEAMPPEEVVTLLRQFHERMAGRIFAYGGTVEKYIGDALIATFGVPVASTCDAGRALLCGADMLTALEQWNSEREAAGEAVLALGIGIHYGPAVIGDVGSERSMAFTVVGDTVNTASRLQSLTRTIGTALLASDAIVKAAGKELNQDQRLTEVLERLRDAGEQALRGRSRTVRVWEDPGRRLLRTEAKDATGQYGVATLVEGLGHSVVDD